MANLTYKTALRMPGTKAAAAQVKPHPGKEAGEIKLDVHELNRLIRWARVFMQITVFSMIISVLVGIIALLSV